MNDNLESRLSNFRHSRTLEMSIEIVTEIQDQISQLQNPFTINELIHIFYQKISSENLYKLLEKLVEKEILASSIQNSTNQKYYVKYSKKNALNLINCKNPEDPTEKSISSIKRYMENPDPRLYEPQTLTGIAQTLSRTGFIIGKNGQPIQTESLKQAFSKNGYLRNFFINHFIPVQSSSKWQYYIYYRFNSKPILPY